MKKLYWTAFAQMNVYSNLLAITGIIDRFGCITLANCFSDVTIIMVIEIEPSQVGPLYQALSEQVLVTGHDFKRPPGEKEVTLLLHITV
ncbi:hypothetical protein [Dyadobacter sp. 676]|uniref:ACT domain-containing protein n=1 Tax=Dyadobacter sp. 676 TaxID=3088362 RepID=A0AAU8FJ29_9BACT